MPKYIIDIVTSPDADSEMAELIMKKNAAVIAERLAHRGFRGYSVQIMEANNGRTRRVIERWSDDSHD